MSDRTNVIAIPLFAWRPLQLTSGFVYLYGHVEYRHVMADKQARADILSRSACEVHAQHSRTDLVFDHCHDHGWVRGVVCHSCNVKLGQVDAARKLAGIAVVPGNTGFGRIIASCPGGIENIGAWMKPKGPFTRPAEPSSPDPNVIVAEFVVGRDGTVHAYLGDRTACGLKAAKTRTATTQTRYCTTCSRIVPASTWESAIRYRFARGIIPGLDGDDPEAA